MTPPIRKPGALSPRAPPAAIQVVDARLRLPFSMIVAGSSQSGKTEFCKNLLFRKENFFDANVTQVIWICAQKTKQHAEIERKLQDEIVFLYELPHSFEDLYATYRGKKLLFVIDDLMDEVCKNEQILQIFVRECHHRNVSLIVIMQDIFYGSGHIRKTFLRNCHYLALFRSPMDMTVVDIIARRVMPRRQKLFYKIFEHATKQPYGHLFISGHPKTTPEIKFRSGIFDLPQTVYTVG